MFPGFSKLVGFVSPIFDWNEVTILGVCPKTGKKVME
jgi:hypothetical protein